MSRVLRAALRTVRLYATLGWVYILANSISHPYTMDLQLSHLSSWPNERTFGWTCFVLSLASVFALRLQQEPTP